MSGGSEFEVIGSATENAHHANSVHVFAANSSGASQDSRGRTGTAGWISSFRYTGIDDESIMNITSTSCRWLVASLAASEATGEVV